MLLWYVLETFDVYFNLTVVELVQAYIVLLRVFYNEVSHIKHSLLARITFVLAKENLTLACSQRPFVTLCRRWRESGIRYNDNM